MLLDVRTAVMFHHHGGRVSRAFAMSPRGVFFGWGCRALGGTVLLAYTERYARRCEAYPAQVRGIFSVSDKPWDSLPLVMPDHGVTTDTQHWTFE